MRVIYLLPFVAASVASAQIVVSRPGEEVSRPVTIEAVVCQLNLGDGRSAISELIWVPNDPATLAKIGQEFEAYGKSISRFTNNSACHQYPSYSWYPKPAGTTVDKMLYTGWSGSYPTRYPGDRRVSSTPAKPRTAKAPSAPTPAPAPAIKGPTPNQLKYQRELDAYNQRLAEIERIKADTAARHGASKQAAKQQLDSHDQDMARHRQEAAAVAERQRLYRQEVEDHQRLVERMQTKSDRERKVEWREAVVVCDLKSSDGQSQFGNWRCEGPLQMTYAKLGGAGTGLNKQSLVALSQACGGREESVRDLGMVAGSRLFGCSFGLHPQSQDARRNDQAIRHGIAYVPGRATYRCPAYVSYCRTQ